MRPAKLLLFAAIVLAAVAQQPINVGPDASAGYGPGMVKFFSWYTGTPSGGCVAGSSGACVGPSLQGDTYYWTAWLPNASGLPVTSGLPVVGTLNDWSFAGCNGNVGVLQMDKFSWEAPTASHVTKVNCMTSYGTAPSAINAPAGWNGHLTSSDSSGEGTWKNRPPFSKGGILYLPVERQISAGNYAVHDATMLMSPDSGKHWCNPYTYWNRAGGPGCDSSNWQADGDAPKCDAASSSTPCTNTAYLDSTHSSMMWKLMPATPAENMLWINYGYQDGQTPPSDINDGCDPATYTCFMLGDGSLARTTDIMDPTAYVYYSCPTMTPGYRCPGADPANWTATFTSRTPVLPVSVTGTSTWWTYGWSVLYLKEFKSYAMAGVGYGYNSNDFLWAPTIQGPWTHVYRSNSNALQKSFTAFSPALGYNVLSIDPPRVQVTVNSNNYLGGEGSPEFRLFDLTLGQSRGGEAFASTNLNRYIAGAGFQFSSGNIAGSFPRKGLVWSFDFLDMGLGSTATDFYYFLDRANQSVAMVACDGSPTAPINCGNFVPTHGTSVSAGQVNISDSNEDYGAHLRAKLFHSMAPTAAADAPIPVTGDAEYSVVGVYKNYGTTPYNRWGSLWTFGTASGTPNSMLHLNVVNKNLRLSWNGQYNPGYQYISKFTFPNNTNWYFVAVTVRPQGGACTTLCTPSAKIWVGGATTAGVLEDVLSGVSYTASGTAVKTPAVAEGPFVLGRSPSKDSAYVSVGSLLVYSRALTSPEVQSMYRSMKAKMAVRGISLQ